tara:strand:+ start:827 stop:1027 length:201 start_codon:yes stop_codon:yes gene_type:complete
MDSIVKSVLKQFTERAEFGKEKYGVDLDREDLVFGEWVTHMKEELMDAILYLEKLEKLYKNGKRTK